MIEFKIYTTAAIPAKLPGGNGGFKLCPNLLTESPLTRFLRTPQISKAQNYRNAIAHLKRYRNLPHKGLSFPARQFYCIRFTSLLLSSMNLSIAFCVICFELHLPTRRSNCLSVRAVS